MTTDDLNPLRDEVAAVLAREWWVASVVTDGNHRDWAERAWLDMGGSEPSEERAECEIVAQEVADALMPLLARSTEAARAEARVPAVFLADDHEECDKAERAAYERGLAEGEARVRARVEGVLDVERLSESRFHTIRALDVMIRAALAEPTGREDADAHTPQNSPETATGAIGGVSSDSRGADEGTGTL